MDLQFITSNIHKFKEIKNKLSTDKLHIHHLMMKYGEPQADTIKDVARASLANLIPVVDGNFFLEDSGIVVDALNGFPGPYSSFAYQTIGWRGLLDLMISKKNRSTQFLSVIALYFEGEVALFEGITKGHIAREGKGDSGFGFDPIFIPNGQDLTYAQMDVSQKNQHSHRAKAFEKMVNYMVELF